MLGLKKIKKIVLPIVTAAMLLPAVAGIAKAETRPQIKKQIEAEEIMEEAEEEEESSAFKSFLKRLEFQLDYTNALYLKNPVGDYYKQLNKDFRTGKYTFRSPIHDWKDIKTPGSAATDFGMEVSCLYKLGKNKPSSIWVLGYVLTDDGNIKTGAKKDRNLRIGPVVGVRISSPNSTYDKTYIINSHTSPIQRQEGINTITVSLGARGKASLTDKLDASATVGVNLYKVKGNVNTTLRDVEYDYTQWRKTDYKGKGTGLSLEAGVNYEFRKNIWVGAALGYRTGKVKTKGKQVITETSNPGMSWTKDYSPEFDPSGAYGKLIFGLRF